MNPSEAKWVRVCPCEPQYQPPIRILVIIFVYIVHIYIQMYACIHVYGVIQRGTKICFAARLNGLCALPSTRCTCTRRSDKGTRCTCTRIGLCASTTGRPRGGTHRSGAIALLFQPPRAGGTPGTRLLPPGRAGPAALGPGGQEGAREARTC